MKYPLNGCPIPSDGDGCKQIGASRLPILQRMLEEGAAVRGQGALGTMPLIDAGEAINITANNETIK
ncbi:MAG: hypothetical protein C5617_007020 [ANME-2 cluster archaeon]|nr:MAG: hypothetical protein C5617_007020 [ANME-2 cluster archaeon]